MPELKQEPIRFSGSQKAVAVLSSSEDAAAEIQSKLNLAPYNAIILVFGSADSIEAKVVPRLTQLCRRGIASAAADAKAVILDGGTNAGVAMLMGAGVASRNTKISLIGVAPKGRVSFPGLKDAPVDATPLEPNHSHFVLVEGNEWGNETPTLFNLADALMKPETADTSAQPDKGMIAWKDRLTRRKKDEKEERQSAKEKRIPALAILIGGGEISKNEVVQAVRRKIPLIVVKGSGGLAEDVTTAFNKTDVLPDDPDLAEIIGDGDIHLHSLNDLVEGMNRLILRELATDKVLQQAWQTFATYDLNAGLQQTWFKKLQAWILWLGVVGTTLAICSQVLHSDFRLFGWRPFNAVQLPYHDILRWILILIPISLTALVAASNRFKQGNKWMLLRAAAESIKREIYKYRVRGYYKELDSANADTRTDEDVKRQEQLTPEQELTHRVEDITRRVMRTEVNSTALKQYTKGVYPPAYGQPVKDDGFSPLTPDKYVEVRLDEQVTYFQGKTPRLQQQFFRLTCGILIVGATGTFLSAVGWPVWIALTTALAAAFTTYLGYMQVESTLTKYNQAATDLENVKGWWNALSASEQAMMKNIQLLVDHTEDVLQTELDGWVQQMKDALESLRKQQESDKPAVAKAGGAGGNGGGNDGGNGGEQLPQAPVPVQNNAGGNQPNGTEAGNVQAIQAEGAAPAIATVETEALQNNNAEASNGTGPAMSGEADAATVASNEDATSEESSADTNEEETTPDENTNEADGTKDKTQPG